MLRESIPEALAGERIDRVVALVCGVSRNRARDLVAQGAVRISGRPAQTGSARVQAGDEVEVDLGPVTDRDDLKPDPTVPFEVVHADDDVIVVDKPPGVVVHPGAGRSRRTLVHGLLAAFPDVAEVGEWPRPGIVHRLDKDTSGLLVVARTPAAYDSLVAQLAERRVTRRYLALVWGTPHPARGVVDAPIGRSSRAATKMAVTTGGRSARTRYEVDRAFSDPVELALVRCELETGRTHQIRVHLAAIDHPVVGDGTYGGARRSFPVPRPFLHATHLDFVHPITGEGLAFDSPLPADLESVVSRLS